MTQTANTAVRIPPELRLSAAMRLVSGAVDDRERAGRRLIATAPAFGIDLDLLWGTIAPGADGRPTVRQAVLAVPGSGRTAMLFISGPGPAQEVGPVPAQAGERVAALREAFAGLSRSDRDIVLAQALPEPGEHWAIEACRGAAMVHVGDLAYLRRSLRPTGPARLNRARSRPPAWPAGVTVVEVRDAEDFEPGGDGAALQAALEASYVDTLDCPELCGLRSTRDVLASHMATGKFDPSTWWIVREGDEPAGCMLMTHCPDHDSVELVYLGLGPRLRGRGLARRLMEFGIERVARCKASELTCAVDRRNTPALRLYTSLGFGEFTARVAYVRPLSSPSVTAEPATGA